MRSLLRLASWGIAATAALLIAVLVGNTSGGQQRLNVAVATLTGKSTTKLAKAQPPGAAQLARLEATELETRRLNEMVRSLNTDRERLLNRLSMVERNLEDVTGSIRKQAAAPPPAPTPPPAATPAPDLAPPPNTTAPQQQTPPEEGTASPPPPAQAPDRVATVEPPPAAPDAERPPERRPPIGVDVGGAPNFDGLRALWKSVTSSHAALFDGLQPIVSARESSKSHAADLRLIVGPLTDAEAAGRICATLTAAKRFCRPVVFAGQPMALAAPEPPRRPKAAPERKAPSRPPLFPN